MTSFEPVSRVQNPGGSAYSASFDMRREASAAILVKRYLLFIQKLPGLFFLGSNDMKARPSSSPCTRCM